VVAIAMSRDCVIVRLRRFVHGKNMRENAVAEEPPAPQC